MPTRVLIAYLLLAIMLAGGALAIRWVIRNSDHSVHRRARRERRERYKADLEAKDKDGGH